MRLPKRLSDAVFFAAWCKREGKEPAAIARLIVLAHKAKAAGETWCNVPHYPRERYDKAMAAFEAAAVNLGYQVDWPGLWPTLRNMAGQHVDLPSL